MQTISVNVQKDHLSKLANVTPEKALSELIWNSLDAEADNVKVHFNNSQLKMDSITVIDNGHAFSFEEANSCFSSLGGSWKLNSKKTRSLKRFLHGKEGQGRFRAFSLGSFVEWFSVYNKDLKKYSFSISSTYDDIKTFHISDIKEVHESTPVGVTVKISNIYKDLRFFDEQIATEKITPIFALYLENYSGVNIWIENKKLDSKTVIDKHKTILLNDIKYEGKLYKNTLEIIEWKDVSLRSIYFSDYAGFPLEDYDKNIRGLGDFSYSAYLKSDFYTEMQKSGLINVPETIEELKDAIKESVKEIKNYFIKRTLENSQNQIDSWKAEKIYPYLEDAKDTIEKAERQVFDILALNVNSHLPEFGQSDTKVKAFQFRMLRQAIEKNPQELQIILREVLQLPKEKQVELAELLEETSLASIISASKLVTDRLKFLQGFEEIVFNTELKKLLKERSQLHRILADNTWVFGDAFSLTVDDKSLTEVLRKHKKSLNEEIVIDKPVKRIDSSAGIVDLMLSKSVPRNHSNEREHLIVELKAPKVPIGQKEIGQIQSYAFAVSEDERFRSLITRWEFWVISNDYDKYAEKLLKQANYSDSVIYRSDASVGIDITIKIKTWSELIQDCKHRLEFIKQQLNYNIDRDSGLDYLKDKYAKYTQGILMDEDNTQPEKYSDNETENSHPVETNINAG